MTSKPTLKSKNMKWLVALATADVIVLGLLLAPAMLGTEQVSFIAIARGLAIFVLPVLILLLVNVAPHDVKSALVYWKPLGVLPGCEAFSKYGPRDGRIDMDRLKQKLGAIPRAARDQNSTWYRLFKEVENLPEIEEAHRHFLLYRDMAVMSLVFCPLAPTLLYLAGSGPREQWYGALAMGVQYLLTALSARWSGIRFVCNVLAVQSTTQAS